MKLYAGLFYGLRYMRYFILSEITIWTLDLSYSIVFDTKDQSLMGLCV